MDIKQMLGEVEAEIAKLQRVADALRGSEPKQTSNHGRGHGMSAAARRKISLAGCAVETREFRGTASAPNRVFPQPARQKPYFSLPSPSVLSAQQPSSCDSRQRLFVLA